MLPILWIHNRARLDLSLRRKVGLFLKWTEVGISKIVVSGENWPSWLLSLRSCLTSSTLFKIEWNFVPSSEGIFESISVFFTFCLVGGETTVTLNDVGVSSCSILVVLDWLTMEMRTFLGSIFPEMFLAWEETTWVKLASWLLHLIKTTIVIVNISISAATVWLIDDSSVSHHLDSVVVTWG